MTELKDYKTTVHVFLCVNSNTVHERVNNKKKQAPSHRHRWRELA
ncbi:hypothetical protein ACIGEL_21260 [Rossellomorea aquimaris]